LYALRWQQLDNLLDAYKHAAAKLAKPQKADTRNGVCLISGTELTLVSTAMHDYYRRQDSPAPLPHLRLRHRQPAETGSQRKGEKNVELDLR